MATEQRDRQIVEGQIKIGDILFLPRVEEPGCNAAYLPPVEVQGHPVVVIDIFSRNDRVDVEKSSWVWVLLVSRDADNLLSQEGLLYSQGLKYDEQALPSAQRSLHPFLWGQSG